uniref:Uncharacterized protein n=1 Tax=Siphoviridae sp. cteLh2 TaxID=2825590 RepID=A0A8S5U652_9CAUD|nr:MAG TPA: hypothetical protein [Siphoviridae sp. cteLh2]
MNYSPLIEVRASWSIYLTVQVYPSYKDRSNLSNYLIFYLHS